MNDNGSLCLLIPINPWMCFYHQGLDFLHISMPHILVELHQPSCHILFGCNVFHHYTQGQIKIEITIQ